MNPWGYWTYDRCFESAQRFNSLREWRLNCYGSYKAMKSKNKHRLIGEILGWKMQKRNHWSVYENCLEVAKDCKSFSEWLRRNRSSYNAAWRQGWHLKIGQELGWDLSMSYTVRDAIKRKKDIKNGCGWMSDE